MAVDKAASVVKGGVQAAQQRIDATLGGRIASAIKAQGTTTVGADELKAAPVFDDNSLAGAEPVSGKQGISSRFEQRNRADGNSFGRKSNPPIFEEWIQSRADEKSVDAESEVAAFRDRETKPT